MDMYPIITTTGFMTDREHMDSSNLLLMSVNATSYQLSGIAKDIASVYNHANVFEGRQQLFDLNRAICSSRPNVGRVIVKEPPNNSCYPCIAAIVSQFGSGECIEKNTKAQYFVGNSRDMHYVNGLKCDTFGDRVNNFKMGLENTVDYLFHNSKIKKVIMPRGIGRGLPDQDWVKHYLPIIEDIAYKLIVHDVRMQFLEIPPPQPQKPQPPPIHNSSTEGAMTTHQALSTDTNTTATMNNKDKKDNNTPSHKARNNNNLQDGDISLIEYPLIKL